MSVPVKGDASVGVGAPGAPAPDAVVQVEPRTGSPLLAQLLRVRSWGPLLALILLCIGFTIANSRFATLDNARAIADQASVICVLSVGLTFVILMGAIDLSIEGVMASSSTIVALLVANTVNDHELGYTAVLIAVAAGGAIGLVNGLINTRLRVPSFMVTLGTGAMGLGLATVLFGQTPPRILDPGLRSWALEQTLGVSRLALLALGCVAVGVIVQRYTRMGRYAYVIGGGEDVARLSGIRVERYKTMIFAFAGVTFGLAGVMVAMRSGVGSPTAGNGDLFAAITAVVVGGTLLSGGRGGVLHSVVGVLIITVLDNGMLLLGADESLQQSVHGLLIVVAVGLATWSLRTRMRVIK
jgi:ribose transport system permease protein